MPDRAPQRKVLEALEAALDAQARKGAERIDSPRPLEFDRNGFPVAQRWPSFVTRVTRLLHP
jgi:hypothetical protein